MPILAARKRNNNNNNNIIYARARSPLFLSSLYRPTPTASDRASASATKRIPTTVRRRGFERFRTVIVRACARRISYNFRAQPDKTAIVYYRYTILPLHENRIHI